MHNMYLITLYSEFNSSQKILQTKSFYAMARPMVDTKSHGTTSGICKVVHIYTYTIYNAQPCGKPF